jgi:hypothetical protein
MICYKSVTDMPSYFTSDLYRPGAFTISCACFSLYFFQKCNWTILETNQNVIVLLMEQCVPGKKKTSLVLRTDLTFHSLLLK